MEDVMKARLILLIILNNIFVQFVLSQHIFDNVDPSVSQFKIDVGSGDPGYNGDLDFPIPLMTVPGRAGLNYDITLQYVMGNGVPASESSSSIGLGWNLNQYEVTCSPAYGQEPDQIGINSKDTYYLIYPGGSTPIVEFDDGWYPLKWKKLKIKAIEGDRPDPNSYDYKMFIVYDTDGTKYIYAEKLMQESLRILKNHCINPYPCNHTLGKHPYYYVFKLSAILGADYMDGNGDYIPGNGGTDTGSWIKLSYTTVETLSCPTNPDKNFFIQMQINNISRIETPTHYAQFFYNTSSPTRKIIYRGVLGNTLTSKLTSIHLYDKTSDLHDYVTFNSTNSFTWVEWFNKIGKYYRLVDSGYQRLKLNSVSINGAPSYKFSYNPGPNLSLEDKDDCALDYWGFFNRRGNIKTTYNGYHDYWMLSEVTYPTGGKITFDYEPDRYMEDYWLDDSDIWYQGGARLVQKTIMPDPDNPDEESIYQYKYAQSNISEDPEFDFRGVGFLSGRLEMRPDAYSHEFIYKSNMGMNSRDNVQYPDIEITLPNGSIIKRYYTCSFSGENRQLYLPEFGGYIPPEPHLCYLKSYANVTCETDPLLLTLSTSHPYHNIFFQFDPTLDDPSCIYFNDPTFYPTRQAAAIGEAKEFHDSDQLFVIAGITAYKKIFDNSWKRGYITREELYNNDDPIEVNGELVPNEYTIYYYTMTPKESKVYFIEDDIACLLTSGFVRLDKKNTRYNTAYYIPRTGISEEYLYNLDTGLKIETVRKKDISAKRRDKLEYAYQHYPVLIDSNMLSQVVRTETQDPTNSNIPVSCSASTWKDWGNGLWAPVATYNWQDNTGGTIPTFLWDASSTQNDEWVKQNQIISRDNHGQVVEQIQPQRIVHTRIDQIDNFANSSIRETILRGIEECRTMALIKNAKAEECGVFDAESKWDKGDWGNSNNGIVVRDEDLAHTGHYCVECEEQYGPTKNFYWDGSTGIDKNKTYIAEAWIKRETGQGKIKVQVYNNLNVPQTEYVESVVSSGTEWQRIKVVIGPSIMADMTNGWYLRLFCGFPYSDNIGYVDDVRFYPEDATITSYTYHPRNGQITSVTDQNHLSKKFGYDTQGRLISIKNEEGNEVNSYSYYYSRPNNSDEYDPEDPNFIMSVSYPNEPTSDNKVIKTFYDGLGREIQNQTRYDGNTDIMTRQTYDEMGNVFEQFKPRYILNTQDNYITNDEIYFDEVVFSNITEIVNNLYIASQITIRENVQWNEGHLEVRAKNSIRLLPGFSVTNNGTFIASVNHDDPGLYKKFEYEESPHPRILKETYYGYSPYHKVLNSYSYKCESATKSITQTDGKGVKQKVSYDYFDKPVTTYNAFDSGDQVVWSQEYDVLDNVILTRPPNYHEYLAGNYNIQANYNTLNQLTQRITPEDVNDVGTKYIYDANGNLIYEQNADQRENGYKFTVYWYDEYNRLTQVGEETYDDWSSISVPLVSNSGTYATGSDEWKIKYYYDDNYLPYSENYCKGRLTKTVIQNPSNEPNSEFYYVYDKCGNMIRKDYRSYGETYQITHYTYDSLGRITEIQYPSGLIVCQTYDGAGRLEKVYSITD